MAKKKDDPFLDALHDEGKTGRPRTRTKSLKSRAGAPMGGAPTRPLTGVPTHHPATRPATTHLAQYAKSGAGSGVNFELKQLPVPIKAAFFFGLYMGLATLLAPLMGRLIVGPRGLDNVMATFATETGVSTLMMGLAVPAIAMNFALVVYFRAKVKVVRMGQSLSRALLVGLLTWMSFSAWATHLWCLPADYGECYSKVLTVSGLLGGGPVLLAGLIAGYVVGRGILKREPNTR